MSLDTAKKKLKVMQEQFNARNIMYQVQLNKFFNIEDRNYYIDSIYNPLIEISRFCAYNDTTIVKEKTYPQFYGQIDIKTRKFIEKIYNEIK